MDKVLLLYGLVSICTYITSALQAFTADQKLRQCEDGDLTYQRVTGVHEETVTFYMQTTAQSERDCVMMCYERLQFCNSVKFVPDEHGGDGGTCSFAYFRGDCRDTTRTSHGLVDISAVTFAIPTNMFSCIRCVPYGPSFVQAVEDNNEVGPALLVQNVIRTTTAKPDTIDRTKVAKNHLSYREYKSFNYLLPACAGNLTYSTQPTLMLTKPSVYTAGMNIATVRECAVLCHRQHFCTSAIWRSDECLLSYEKSACSDKPLPVGYKDAVLISCLKCEDVQ